MSGNWVKMIQVRYAVKTLGPVIAEFTEFEQASYLELVRTLTNEGIPFSVTYETVQQWQDDDDTDLDD